MYYIINPTVGHDCTFEELKRGLIKVDVLEKGTKKYKNHLGKEYVLCTVMMYRYKRYYPSTRLTTDHAKAERYRQEILDQYKQKV